MQNQFYRKLFVFLGVLLALSGQTFAQNLHLSVFGGWNKPGEVTLENARSGLNGNSEVGVRFETDFARIIGIEHTFAYSPDFGSPETFATTANSRGIIYHSNFVLNAPLGHLVPFATIGIGLINSNRQLMVTSPPFTIREFGTQFAVNYGGGVKFTRLAGPLGVRVDVRGYTLPNVFSERLNIFEISGGVMISF